MAVLLTDLRVPLGSSAVCILLILLESLVLLIPKLLEVGSVPEINCDSNDVTLDFLLGVVVYLVERISDFYVFYAAGKHFLPTCPHVRV